MPSLRRIAKSSITSARATLTASLWIFACEDEKTGALIEMMINLRQRAARAAAQGTARCPGDTPDRSPQGGTLHGVQGIQKVRIVRGIAGHGPPS